MPPLSFTIPHLIQSWDRRAATCSSLVSQQYGLLTNDAIVVAVMQAHGLSKLASHDADFDHVPGITRYAPA